jgi:hypothetical protein
MCFTTDKNDFDIQSVIMKEIYEYIGGEKETFYENIEFCVFCVFNWSRTANNPPPVAYVDINYFKQMIYSGDQATFNMEEFKSLMNYDSLKTEVTIGSNNAQINLNGAAILAPYLNSRNLIAHLGTFDLYGITTGNLFLASGLTSGNIYLGVNATATTGRTGITAEPVSMTALATLSNTDVGVKQRAAS